jgi:hypothetical protein
MLEKSKRVQSGYATSTHIDKPGVYNTVILNSANFSEYKVSRGQRNESPLPLVSVF